MPGRLAQPLSFRGVRKESERNPLKLGGVLYLKGASGLNQPVGGILEIPDMGTENDGRSIGGRLDHVLSAAPAVEAAADKGHVGQAPKGAQLADGIY